MKFLVDRCAGRRLADWLRQQGHDVSETHERGPDPGDLALLEWASAEGRILITIDTDFGKLLFVGQKAHCGLVRLPDVPASERISLMTQVIERYSQELASAAIITIRKGRIRISKQQNDK